MKKALFIIILIALHGRVFAQSSFSTIDKFEDSRLSFYAKYLAVKPFNDAVFGGLTFNFKWHKRKSEQWESRFMWEQTLLSDWAGGFFGKLITGRPVMQPWPKSGLDHAFSSGFFGSFQYGLNAFASDKLIITPCVSFGDNLVAVQRFEDHNQLPPEEYSQLSMPGNIPYTTYRDPAGYFFFAGPGLVASYIPKNDFWIDAFFTYEFTAYNVGETNIKNFIHVDGYPNPNFLSVGLTLNHRSGLLLGTRYYSLINRGNTDTGIFRLDFNFGYNF